MKKHFMILLLIFQTQFLFGYITEGHITILNDDGNHRETLARLYNPDYSTNYSGDVYQGVFLNQNPQFEQGKPIYSVRAEAEQTIPFHGQNITWYFQGWEGTNVQYQNAGANETPLVFQNANAQARAVYKGHGASSVARATGYNNGRRMARENDNTLHMVYQDGYDIWYTYSNNNGQTSQKEFKVAISGKNPSIAAASGLSSRS